MVCLGKWILDDWQFKRNPHVEYSVKEVTKEIQRKSRGGCHIYTHYRGPSAGSDGDWNANESALFRFLKVTS